MPPRGSRAEHYRAISGFYGSRLIEDIFNPNVPEFVILQDARRTAHYALAALELEARPRRKAVVPALAVAAPWAAVPAAGDATSGSIPV
ncbi:MAG: hypothetical protein EHM24_01370 [Acidobacteria bacterium]|nr:MAG: hypothetical protein EHM24_01370 [Acidobacteriota bacterium]